MARWLRFAVLLMGLLLGPVARADTYVLVHGAWGGGWSFKQLDRLLAAQGHTVYRPTLTGLGERVHLASPDIGLQTHIEDVANLVRYEDLHDVTLLGHSYGGMVITGVYDRMPERIRRMVYVDAMLPEDGENALGFLGLRKLLVKAFTRDGFIRFPKARPDQPPRNEHQPARTFSDPISLKKPPPPKDKALYILTVEVGEEADGDNSWRHAERAGARGWKVIEMPGDHNVHVSAPAELVRLLTAEK